jgi:hypothetical protein
MDFDVFAGPYLHYIIKEAKKVLLHGTVQELLQLLHGTAMVSTTALCAFVVQQRQTCP